MHYHSPLPPPPLPLLLLLLLTTPHTSLTKTNHPQSPISLISIQTNPQSTPTNSQIEKTTQIETSNKKTTHFPTSNEKNTHFPTSNQNPTHLDKNKLNHAHYPPSNKTNQLNHAHNQLESNKHNHAHKSDNAHVLSIAKAVDCELEVGGACAELQELPKVRKVEQSTGGGPSAEFALRNFVEVVSERNGSFGGDDGVLVLIRDEAEGSLDGGDDNSGGVVNWSFLRVCRAMCGLFLRRIDKCPECALFIETRPKKGHLGAISEDWNDWCNKQCSQGDGGVACSCDLLPLL